MERGKIKSYRLASLILSLFILAALFAGCTDSTKETETTGSTASDTGGRQTSAAETGDYSALLDTVSDSSELPTWTGKALNFKMWWASGAGGLKQFVSENDVVGPEIQRVTGVTQDLEGSYDNNNTDYNTRLSLVIASNDWPDIIVNAMDMKKLVDAGIVYDLTDLIPEYCPHIMQKIPKEGLYGEIWKNTQLTGSYEGKAYAVPYSALISVLPQLDKTIDPERLGRIIAPQDSNLYSTIEIREDLLKKLYPDALTQDEIEDIYMQYGTFAKNQIFDVPIKTKDDFIKLLYDLKDLIDRESIKEGEQKVEVAPGRYGGDMFPLLNFLNTRLEGLGATTGYATYYDKTTKKIEFAPNQQWFKDDMRLYNKLVRDGIFSKESLVDSAEITQSKINNGLYALVYSPWNLPNDSIIQKTKEYRYRILNTDIPFNNKVDLISRAPGGWFISIPRSAVKEEDLPQILKWIDFMVSDTGEKLVWWGPKTANLWKEVDGKRIFTNKKLEDNLVYNVNNGEDMKYGLFGATAKMPLSFRFLATAYSSYDENSPIYQYDSVKRSRANAKTNYNPAVLIGQGYNSVDYMIYMNSNYSPSITSYINNVTDAGTKFWTGGWTLYNENLLKCMAAKDDTEFEAKYKQMMDDAAKSGLDDNGIAEIDTFFRKMNPGYIESVK